MKLEQPECPDVDRSGLFPIPIVLSAVLLFLVQPIIAKRMPPWFGGSASVWNTCIFSSSCCCSAAISTPTDSSVSRPRRRRRSPRRPAGALPRQPSRPRLELLEERRNRPLPAHPADARDDGRPAVFSLSSTSPLLQAWFARTMAAPYRLFALSNAASLCRLLVCLFCADAVPRQRYAALSFALAIAVAAAWPIAAEYARARVLARNFYSTLPIFDTGEVAERRRAMERGASSTVRNISIPAGAANPPPVTAQRPASRSPLRASAISRKQPSRAARVSQSPSCSGETWR